ncbi:MAG TPA: hypothetical protein PKL15_07510 [Saprospiraceae bacterium]|nr:hypothetical protein [Saprospiraceae bacterium]HNL37544.1 hypothetical protein [Saprospiraceae bacterium]HNM25259.1 hypothetical protein [Saprospiraceae bacterium]
MKYLFICLFACFCTASFGQVYLGVSGSAGLSYWKWQIHSLDVDAGLDPALGWRYAALVDWRLAPWAGIRTELGTQVKAGKLDGLTFPDMTSTGVYRERYQYWEGSLMIELYPFKKMRAFYLTGGATVGYLGRARRRSSITENGEHHTSTSPIELDNGLYNRTLYAADGGLGVQFSLDPVSRLRVEGRMQYGLNNYSAHSNVDARVSSVMLGVAYLHRL